MSMCGTVDQFLSENCISIFKRTVDQFLLLHVHDRIHLRCYILGGCFFKKFKLVLF